MTHAAHAAKVANIARSTIFHPVEGREFSMSKSQRARLARGGNVGKGAPVLFCTGGRRGRQGVAASGGG
ncbi:protein of unknown function [uncultured Sphingopyxis sp.]|uniref:Uncharacterized protein n=1 Tax=uncultured Sphingopyxis sp. TaxID=310581 RepID=A0A1Y5PZU4_9SPHN|nr:protein of unknown function [uncultured Sphingopyxis sp.]